MPPITVMPFERLELQYTKNSWPFAEGRRPEIDAHFALLSRANPNLWNGRALLLHRFAAEGAVFRGAYLETDYASFLAWRDWDFPDASMHNCFGLAALRASDGAFLVGVMGAHTASAGSVYFVGGTPDPEDIVGDAVDLGGNVLRELREETGLTAADVTEEPGWHAVFAGPRIAMLKVLDVPLPAVALRERILGFLSRETKPELADMRIVRGPADLDPMMPAFMPAFLLHAWG